MKSNDGFVFEDCAQGIDVESLDCSYRQQFLASTTHHAEQKKKQNYMLRFNPMWRNKRGVGVVLFVVFACDVIISRKATQKYGSIIYGRLSCLEGVSCRMAPSIGSTQSNNGFKTPRIFKLKPEPSIHFAPGRIVDQFPAPFSDATQLYPELDSEDSDVSQTMEMKTFPRHEFQEECVPMSNWQLTFHPTCNFFHELGISGKLGEESIELIHAARGSWRNTWKTGNGYAEEESIVLKTLRYMHNFEDRYFENNRVEAVTMDMLTSSPYIIDIHGFCGMSIFNEFGWSRKRFLKKKETSPEQMIHIARQIAEGLAAIHGIDDDRHASVVHNDLNPSSLLFSDEGVPKLNDFNLGVLLMRNNHTNETCGFLGHHDNAQMRSPEEQLNEDFVSQKMLSEKIDIYGYAGILCYMLTGRNPWTLDVDELSQKEWDEVKAKKVLNGTIPPLPEKVTGSKNPFVVGMRAAMIKCYAKDPADRPSARAVVEFLGKVIELGEAVAIDEIEDLSKSLVPAPVATDTVGGRTHENSVASPDVRKEFGTVAKGGRSASEKWKSSMLSENDQHRIVDGVEELSSKETIGSPVDAFVDNDADVDKQQRPIGVGENVAIEKENSLHKEDPIYLVGITRNLSMIAPNIIESLVRLNCEHHIGVHIVATAGITDFLAHSDLQRKLFVGDRVSSCAAFVVMKDPDVSAFPNRIDRIAYLREFQRQQLRSVFNRNTVGDGVVIVADLDLFDLPPINLLVAEVDRMIRHHEHDVLCATGLMHDPFGYYDTFATILLPDTFTYPLHGRLVKAPIDVESLSMVPSSDRYGEFTQWDLLKYFEREGNKSPTGTVPVRSCFGGLTIYNASKWFTPSCRYIADVREKMQYANNDDGRPCEHVMFHECLLDDDASTRIALNPNLRTKWDAPIDFGDKIKVAKAIPSLKNGKGLVTFANRPDEGLQLVNGPHKLRINGEGELVVEECRIDSSCTVTWSANATARSYFRRDWIAMFLLLRSDGVLFLVQQFHQKPYERKDHLCKYVNKEETICRKAVWSSGIGRQSSKEDFVLVLGTDGELHLDEITTSETIWSSKSTGIATNVDPSRLWVMVWTGPCESRLRSGYRLFPGDFLCSPNGRFRFGMVSGNEFSLWDGQAVTWSASDCCAGEEIHAVMQHDGNLVVYNSEGVLWASNTEADRSILSLDDDGFASIIAPSGDYVWTTAINGDGSLVEPNSLERKIIAGYQGWFFAQGDGGFDAWNHWSQGSAPSKDSVTFEMWPDLRELEQDELYATELQYGDGSNAGLYSAYNWKTVERHFRWMQQYGIHGVFAQRFVSEMDESRHALDGVLHNVKKGSEMFGRVYAIMYDVTGADSASVISKVMDDWRHLVDVEGITASKSYLHHRGRPVLGLWGFGFAHCPAQASDVAQLIDWLKNTSEERYQTTLVGGVPTNWGRLSGDSKTEKEWASVFRSFDVISPWTVGRMKNDEEVDQYRDEHIEPELEECTSLGVDYMPVVFPGFSTSNLNSVASFNEIPRRGGEFFWHQLYNTISVGSSMVYVAMFDEVDEATAIFKLAENSAQVPSEGRFLTLDADQEHPDIPSDWYLRITGKASDILQKGGNISQWIPN